MKGAVFYKLAIVTTALNSQLLYD